MFIAVINEVSTASRYLADEQNFAVAEEQKRKRQIEEFIRKAEPASAHVSWIDRLNPYRLMSANRNAVKVNTLPPNLVLPLKQNVGPDVGALPPKVRDMHLCVMLMSGAGRKLGHQGRDAAVVRTRH
jgi:hypothetical protein